LRRRRHPHARQRGVLDEGVRRDETRLLRLGARSADVEHRALQAIELPRVVARGGAFLLPPGEANRHEAAAADRLPVRVGVRHRVQHDDLLAVRAGESEGAVALGERRHVALRRGEDEERGCGERERRARHRCPASRERITGPAVNGETRESTRCSR
jgi:hypothetical protein